MKLKKEKQNLNILNYNYKKDFYNFNILYDLYNLDI